MNIQVLTRLTDMKSSSRFSMIFCCALTLQACTSNERLDIGPVPVEDRSVDNDGTDSGGLPHHVDTKQRALSNKRNTQSTSTTDQSVVIALLADVDSKIESGDTDRAAAMLERALRLKPKNATLWYRLGLLRLRQKNWQQAINLAKKSNSLAAGNYPLQSSNWKLIAKANSNAGNLSAAKLASEKAKKLEQLN